MSVSLTLLYFYQNPNTNKPSSSAVSVKQLCRIICPKKESDGTTVRRGIINQSTPLIGFDPIENKYDQSGWKTSASISVLREASSLWYYEELTIHQEVEPTMKGPITCRELANLYYTTVGDKVVTNNTRVWSPDLSSLNIEKGWKKLLELTHLLDAMEAFQDSVLINFEDLAGNDSNENSKKQVSQTKDEDTTLQDDLFDEFNNIIPSTSDDIFPLPDDDDNEEYESDGGTNYVRDFQTGNWITSDQVREKNKTKSQCDMDGSRKRNSTESHDVQPHLKKKKKPKFRSKHSKCWIYVTGLPNDCNEGEVASYFSKMGVLDLDPNSQKPKVKLYRYKKGDKITVQTTNSAGESVSVSVPARVGGIKGDASICFARSESVDLAVQLLDDSIFRMDDLSGKYNQNKKIDRIKVQRAKFKQHGEEYVGGRKVSDAKRKVARLAKLQAIGWDDGENGRITGGLKGLCIVVLKHMFDANELIRLDDEEKKDNILKEVENVVRKACIQFGHVEKITIFSKNIQGVVIVKFSQPMAASEAINYYDGSEKGLKGRKVEATFWDGVTDFTVRDEEKEKEEVEKRLDKFGEWLDQQELPQELQLQVEK